MIKVSFSLSYELILDKSTTDQIKHKLTTIHLKKSKELSSNVSTTSNTEKGSKPTWN